MVSLFPNCLGEGVLKKKMKKIYEEFLNGGALKSAVSSRYKVIWKEGGSASGTRFKYTFLESSRLTHISGSKFLKCYELN